MCGFHPSPPLYAIDQGLQLAMNTPVQGPFDCEKDTHSCGRFSFKRDWPAYSSVKAFWGVIRVLVGCVCVCVIGSCLDRRSFCFKFGGMVVWKSERGVIAFVRNEPWDVRVVRL